MREILFKAQRADGNGWVHGNFIRYKGHNEDFTFAIQVLNDRLEVLSVMVIDPETVCQFTGLTDKNGNKIFEGDILEFLDFRGVYDKRQSKNDGYIRGWIGVIEWRDYNGWFLNKSNDHNKSMLSPVGGELEARDNIYIYSNSDILKTQPIVTGNIHQKEGK